MGLVFSAGRAKWLAGVCVCALGSIVAACSSDGLDPRPPADVGFHSAAIPPSQPLVEPVGQARPSIGIETAQAYPAPQNPGDALSEEEAQRTFVDPEGPVIEEPAMSVPEQPSMAAYPRMDSPAPDYPDPEPERPAIQPMSAEDVACRQKLKKMKVRYVDLKPIHDSPSCQIAHPVKVYAIGGVEMKPAATLNCEMAATFAAWTRNELVPSSRWRYFSGVKTIHQGSAYSCRRIARSRTMSAHSRGNALDVMAITLNNGKKISVRKQGLFAFRARGLLNNVRSDGCQYFTTVLGPGYNYDHRDHFHFDLMERKRAACH